jgi:hypothetical protein
MLHEDSESEAVSNCWRAQRPAAVSGKLAARNRAWLQVGGHGLRSPPRRCPRPSGQHERILLHGILGWLWNTIVSRVAKAVPVPVPGTASPTVVAAGRPARAVPVACRNTPRATWRAGQHRVVLHADAAVLAHAHARPRQPSGASSPSRSPAHPGYPTCSVPLLKHPAGHGWPTRRPTPPKSWPRFRKPPGRTPPATPGPITPRRPPEDYGCTTER